MVDTHALIWYWAQDSRLPGQVADLMSSGETEVLVSAISALEIAQKHRLGKLLLPADLMRNFAVRVREESFLSVEVTVDHALVAGRMVREHKDPFDRILAAQSLDFGVPLVSLDVAFDSLGVKRIWD